MDEILYKTLKDYFRTLSLTGYKSYDVVNKILILSFIEELTNTELRHFLTDNDYKLMTDLLYQLFGSTCEISFPTNCINCCYQESINRVALIFNSDVATTIIINEEEYDLPYTYIGNIGDIVSIKAPDIEGFQFNGFYKDSTLLEGNPVDITLSENCIIDIKYLQEVTYTINISGNAKSTTKLSVEIGGTSEAISPNSTGKSYTIASATQPTIKLNSISDDSGLIVSLNNITINGQSYESLPITFTLQDTDTNIVCNIISQEPDRAITFKSIGIPYTFEYGTTEELGNTVNVGSEDVLEVIRAQDIPSTNSTKALYYRITIKDNYLLDNIIFKGRNTALKKTDLSGNAAQILRSYNIIVTPTIYTEIYFGSIDVSRTEFPNTDISYQGTKRYTITNNNTLNLTDTARNIGVANDRIFFIMAPVRTSVRIESLKFGTAPFETTLWSDNGTTVTGVDMFTGPNFNETKSDGTTNLKHKQSDVLGAVIKGKTYYIYYYYANYGCFTDTDIINCVIKNI